MEPMTIPPPSPVPQGSNTADAGSGIDPVVWTAASILLFVGGFGVSLIRSAAGLGAIMAGLGGLGFYFVPTVFGFARKHPGSTGIALLNFFLGWTLLGWLGALIWAVSRPAEPAASSTKTCPACAETILLAAIKCKHCGSAVA